MEFTTYSLQMFADIPASSNTLASAVPTYLNANATTSAGLSAENKTYYDMNLISEAEPKLVHDQFGQKRNIPQGSGKTIEFRQYSPLPKATEPIVEGITPDGQSLEVTAKTATVSQYGGYVTLTDVIQTTAIDNNVVEATKLLGSQAGRTYDTITRNVLQSGKFVLYAPKIVDGAEQEVLYRTQLDATSRMSVALSEQAETWLASNNAPTIDGDYVAIVHPHVEYDIKRDPEFIAWKQYASPEDRYAGEIGRIGKVRFVESTEAKVYRGENLAGTARNLAVNNADGYSAATTIAFDGGTVAVNALKGREILVNGYHCLVASNTASAITISTTADGYDTAITCADNAVIYPGEGGAAGLGVYGVLFMGADAFGTTEIEDGGLRTIVKPLGSGGTSDPLDQRSTVGWKGQKTAEILVEPYLLRVEVTSKYSDKVKEN